MKITSSTSTTSGFTLVELLVVIALVALLAIIAVPASMQALDSARATESLANIRKIGSAALLYASENQGKLPETRHEGRTRSWLWTLYNFVGEDAFAYVSPGETNADKTYSYAINNFLTPSGVTTGPTFTNLFTLRRPSETLLFAETADSYFGSDHLHFPPAVTLEGVAGQVALDRYRSQTAGVYVFADGHADLISEREIASLLSERGRFIINPAESY